MAAFDFNNHSHRRYNPLTRSWVLCSPHRTQRPWQGHRESAQIEKRPHYDPTCYLCPGNQRANGENNPAYESTHVFANDFAAVKSDQPPLDDTHDDLLRVEGVRGECHVICFSPGHDLTMAEMSVDEISHIVDQWQTSYEEMATKDYIKHVQIFENKGAAMGCSNPHPHGQIWSLEQIPEEPQVELESLKEYKDTHGDSCLLCNYAKRETQSKERIVIENDTFVCVVPFWAVWPFETLVLPKEHISSLPKMTAQQKLDLADMLRRVTCRYDNLFECSFPYSMGVHQAPVQGDYDYAHLHLHFYPPLLRSATVRKFLVGFEMLGEPQRDLTPEQAATRLRACSEVHYKHRRWWKWRQKMSSFLRLLLYSMFNCHHPFLTSSSSSTATTTLDKKSLIPCFLCGPFSGRVDIVHENLPFIPSVLVELYYCTTICCHTLYTYNPISKCKVANSVKIRISSYIYPYKYPIFFCSTKK